jgi:hypothetical protein
MRPNYQSERAFKRLEAVAGWAHVATHVAPLHTDVPGQFHTNLAGSLCHVGITDADSFPPQVSKTASGSYILIRLRAVLVIRPSGPNS